MVMMMTDFSGGEEIRIIVNREKKEIQFRDKASSFMCSNSLDLNPR